MEGEMYTRNLTTSVMSQHPESHIMYCLMHYTRKRNKKTNKYFSREKDSRNYWKGSFNFSKTKDLEIKGKEQTSAVSGHQNIHHCWEGTH